MAMLVARIQANNSAGATVMTSPSNEKKPLGITNENRSTTCAAAVTMASHAVNRGRASHRNALGRVKAAGQVDPVDPVTAAGQFLSATHGYVLLEIAGYFGAEGNGFSWVFGPLALSIMIGLGADREEAELAAISALAVFEIT